MDEAALTASLRLKAKAQLLATVSNVARVIERETFMAGSLSRQGNPNAVLEGETAIMLHLYRKLCEQLLSQKPHGYSAPTKKPAIVGLDGSGFVVLPTYWLSGSA
jgi:hypothetical protein